MDIIYKQRVFPTSRPDSLRSHGLLLPHLPSEVWLHCQHLRWPFTHPSHQMGISGLGWNRETVTPHHTNGSLPKATSVYKACPCAEMCHGSPEPNSATASGANGCSFCSSGIRTIILCIFVQAHCSFRYFLQLSSAPSRFSQPKLYCSPGTSQPLWLGALKHGVKEVKKIIPTND